jgi:hypothetical protein
MTGITPYVDVILINNDWQAIQASFINCLYLMRRKTLQPCSDMGSGQAESSGSYPGIYCKHP